MIVGLVPVKRLGLAKSRLRELLADADAVDLASAMLADVVAALVAVPGLARVAVVTEDPEAARVAESLGARALLRDDDGLVPSLDGAAAVLASEGATGVLVVLGDVAGARPEELTALLDALEALGGRGAVLAPSRDGGTAALLRAPWDVLASAFGPDSAARHRALARAGGVPWRELALPSLSLDLDSPEDLDAFLATDKGGERTRSVLERIGWTPRA